MMSLLMPSAVLPDRLDERAFAAATAELRPHVRAVVAAVLGLGRDHPEVDDCPMKPSSVPSKGETVFAPASPCGPGSPASPATSPSTRCARASGSATATVSPQTGEDGTTVDPVDRIADGAPDAFQRLADARRRDAVARAMSALPDGQRQALTMFHMEGLQYQEIAARLGVPLGTVATWVMRARKSVAAAVGVQEES